MTVANDPNIIRDPVPLGIAAELDVLIHSDRKLTTVKTLTTEVVKGWVKDPGGSWYQYTATKDVAYEADGTTVRRNAYITLDTANHATTGTAELRVHVDDELCYPRYEFDFIEEATT